MNPQRDENELRRYREASRELDERPSAATRAAILAAAAREVGARPVDSGAAPVVRPRLRWPWAAAAAVMLSTLAVMMATRTEQEQPTFTASVAPPAETARERTAEPQPPAEATPPVAQAAPPAAAPASEPAHDAQRANVAPRPTQPLRKEKRELAAAPEPAAIARAKTESMAEADASSAGARVAEPVARAPAAAPASPPQPSTAPPMATAESASGAIGGLRSSESREAKEAREQHDTREERSRRQDAAAGMAKTVQKPAADENEATIEQRPEDWLQKIVRLRAGGRHEEADADLKRFRERYPQWPVPPAALAPAATR